MTATPEACSDPLVHKMVHIRRFDSFMCPECDVWVETVCECDPAECEFKAANRPERPSQCKP